MTDQARLRLFLDKAQELAEEPFIATGFKIGPGVRVRRRSNASANLKEPPESEFRSALIFVRQFVSKSEAIFVGRIANLVGAAVDRARRSADPLLRRRAERLLVTFRLQRTLWTWACQSARSLGQGPLSKTVTPEQAADLWINGYYFHSDPAKRAMLRALSEEGAFLHKLQFFNFVTATIIYVLNLKAIIEDAAERGIIAVS